MLFDKDGTLLDFHATWGLALGEAIEASARSEEDAMQAFRLLEFDVTERRVAMSSPFVAETSETVGRMLEAHLDLRTFATRLQSGSTNRVLAAPGADELLNALSAVGVPCAVVTNDDQHIAELQMKALGWSERFGTVIGADSGFGGKPDPGPVRAACRLLNAPEAASWMIGDSLFDMLAGRSAGCRTLLVTNGEAVPDEATTIADLVVESLGELDPERLRLPPATRS